MDRRDILKSLFDPSGFGLEIGPSYNPVLRKSEGYRVEIADYTSAAELRRIHPDADIEHVDHITGGRALTSVITHRHVYDFIIASHVIEHTTDIVQFMADCAALLKETGVLVLAVPDKRHCFDIFQQISSTGDVLQAHLEKRTRHLASRHFDYEANAALRGGIVWTIGQDLPARTIHTVGGAYAGFQKAAASETYLDVHGWYFIPSSFRLIMRDLDEVGESRLREKTFHDSIGPEFFISLSVSAPGCPVERLDLLRQMIVEMQAVPVP